MKHEEALKIAKKALIERGLVCMEPIRAIKSEAMCCFGKPQWFVIFNAEMTGGNTIVIIDDESGEVTRVTIRKR